MVNEIKVSEGLAAKFAAEKDKNTPSRGICATR